MIPVVHDFAEHNARSMARQKEQWVLDLYKRLFPRLRSVIAVNGNCGPQHAGIDRLITLDPDGEVVVDEKFREHPRCDKDVLLELWSNEEREIPGWALKDLSCNFIAYFVVPTRTCRLLAFPPLRCALVRHRAEWVQRYGVKRAVNRRHTTVSVAVPNDVLFEAMGGFRTVRWGEVAS